jgi:hypothetical protein
LLKKKNPDSPGRPLLQSYHVLAHGAGRSAEDQVGAGPDFGVPAVVPGGHLRVVRENEHRRREHSGLPQARGRGRVAGITPLPHMKAPDLRLVSLSLLRARTVHLLVEIKKDQSTVTFSLIQSAVHVP